MIDSWNELLPVDRTLDAPMYLQVYQGIRSHIEDGTIPAQTKLPALRALAAELGVARNTIEAAYGQLVLEGYANSRRGYGYVVEELDASRFGQPEEAVDEQEPGDAERALPACSRATRAWYGTEYDAQGDYPYNFSYGNRTKGSFPLEQWRACEKVAFEQALSGELDSYTEEFGVWGLRACLARRLRETRGVRCEPEQIVLQPGTQEAVSAIVSLFGYDQRKVCMENPGYYASRSTFEQRGCTVIPVPTHKGPAAFVNELDKHHAHLLWLTPSNQFPLGYILPLKARVGVIEWAKREGAYIIEDDYCCEYRYGSQPVSSLQSLDTSGHVIYLGTMSKILSPMLRISYVVLPPDLVERWYERSTMAASSVPWITQKTLEVFMTKGKWNTYVRRTVNMYRHRHSLLVDSLHQTFGDAVDLLGVDAGQHLLLGVRDGRPSGELIEAAKGEGVRVYDLRHCWMQAQHPMDNYVLMGFSSIQNELIPEGVHRLKRAWF